MNNAYLHIMFTHLPMVGLGFAFLMHLYALYSKNFELKKLVFWLYIIVGLMALPAFFTGDGGSEFLQSILKVSEEVTENHEQWAAAFFSGCMTISGFSIIGLYFAKRNKRYFNWIFNLVIFLSIFTLILAAYTGYSGGLIRHTEFN
jgi:hypothetical protein